MDSETDILKHCATATHKVVLHDDNESEMRVFQALRPDYDGFYIDHLIDLVNKDGVADLYVGTQSECRERMLYWLQYGLKLEVVALELIG